METQQQKVNSIAQKIALILIDRGISILKLAFHLDPILISNESITDTLRKYFPKEPITHLDSYYYLISIEQWKELIRADWVDTKNWLADKFDCDNFANAFASNMSMYFEVNSVGRVYGKLYKDNKFIAYHYFNCIIDSEKRIWFFEPINDKLSEVAYQGGLILLGGDRYEPISFFFG